MRPMRQIAKEAVVIGQNFFSGMAIASTMKVRRSASPPAPARKAPFGRRFVRTNNSPDEHGRAPDGLVERAPRGANAKAVVQGGSG